jgi:shikimate 5-dehydrogenase
METLDRIFDLTGRVAVITGGNGGIGLGIAQALAAAGCNVSIWGRNADKNKSAAATMAGCAGNVHTAICDVSDPASVKSAMAASPMPESAAADGTPLSTAPKNSGGPCSRPISTAYSMCFRLPRAT